MSGTDPVVRVVAAALYDQAGRILITERPAGKHMAGRWEFPGGKIAPGETEQQALERELREELGIRMLSGRFVLALTHQYADRRVQLAMWVVERYQGEPHALDGQRLKWVPPATLDGEDILEADRPFVALLQCDSFRRTE